MISWWWDTQQSIKHMKLKCGELWRFSPSFWTGLSPSLITQRNARSKKHCLDLIHTVKPNRSFKHIYFHTQVSFRLHFNGFLLHTSLIVFTILIDRLFARRVFNLFASNCAWAMKLTSDIRWKTVSMVLQYLDSFLFVIIWSQSHVVAGEYKLSSSDEFISGHFLYFTREGFSHSVSYGGPDGS